MSTAITALSTYVGFVVIAANELCLVLSLGLRVSLQSPRKRPPMEAGAALGASPEHLCRPGWLHQSDSILRPLVPLVSC